MKIPEDHHTNTVDAAAAYETGRQSGAPPGTRRCRPNPDDEDWHYDPDDPEVREQERF